MKNTYTYILGILMLTLMFGGQLVSAQGSNPGGLFPGDTATANNTGYSLGDTSLSGNSSAAATTPTAPTGNTTNTNTTPTTPVVPTGNTTAPITVTQNTTQNQSGRSRYLITNPLGRTKSLKDVVLNVVSVVQVLLLMAAVLYLLYAGLMFVTARGESGKITKARNALLWGMVGIALVLGAQAIISAIEGSVKGILTK